MFLEIYLLKGAQDRTREITGRCHLQNNPQRQTDFKEQGTTHTHNQY
jgi:hypothetical protein